MNLKFILNNICICWCHVDLADVAFFDTPFGVLPKIWWDKHPPSFKMLCALLTTLNLFNNGQPCAV